MIFNSSYLCVKRLKLKYRELLKTNQVISKEKNCPLNYTFCGVLDTLGRKLCVKNEESCPLNINNFQNKIFKLLDNNQYIPFENNYYSNYYLNNNNDSQLIAIIKVSQNSPCINPSEKFWDYHYVLESPDKKCTSEIKGDIYDKRYQQISNSISKLQLYDENSITGKLQDINEVDLNKIKNDKVNLYARNFLGLDIKELEKSDISYDKMISSQNSIEKYIFWQMIYSSSIIAFLILRFIMSLIDTCSPEKCSVAFRVNRIKVVFWVLCLIFYFISPIIYLIFYLIPIFPNTNLIKSFLNIKNTDEISVELIHQLNKKSIKNYKFSLSIVIISFFNLIPLVIALKFWGKEICEYINKEWYKKPDEENTTKEPNQLNERILPKEKKEEEQSSENNIKPPLRHKHGFNRKEHIYEKCKACENNVSTAFICNKFPECPIAICNECVKQISSEKPQPQIHKHDLDLIYLEYNRQCRRCTKYYIDTIFFCCEECKECGFCLKCYKKFLIY